MSEVFAYPLIGDWEAHVRGRTPSVARGEPQGLFLEGLASPLEEVEATNASIVYAMDVDSAVGDQLDRAGGRVFEGRGGLGDSEYRRIIQAREVAAVSSGQADLLWLVWLALSGAGAGDATIRRGPRTEAHIPAGKTIPVPPLVLLEASISAAPTDLFLRRAKAVLLDSIVFGYEVSATLRIPAAMTYSPGSPGWNSGVWAIGVV